MNSQDNKAITLISINALILTVIFNLIFSHEITDIDSRLRIIILVIGISSYFISFILFLLSFLLIRRIPTIPNIDFLHEVYMNKSKKVTMQDLVSASKIAWNEVNKQLIKRARLILFGLISFLFGTVFTSFFILNFIINNKLKLLALFFIMTLIIIFIIYRINNN